MQSLGASKPRARKTHFCTWCGQGIKAGHIYHRSTWVDAGDLWEQKAHPICLKMIQDYSSYFSIHDSAGFEPDWREVVEWVEDEAYFIEQNREYLDMKGERPHDVQLL